MRVRCEPLYEGHERSGGFCGIVYDDEQRSTICPHYPLGTSEDTFCKRCDLYRPCACDKAKENEEQHVQRQS